MLSTHVTYFLSLDNLVRMYVLLFLLPWIDPPLQVAQSSKSCYKQGSMDSRRGTGFNSCSSNLWEQVGRVNEILAWKVSLALLY